MTQVPRHFDMRRENCTMLLVGPYIYYIQCIGYAYIAINLWNSFNFKIHKSLLFAPVVYIVVWILKKSFN